MNDFYDIGDNSEAPDGSMQLENLGEQKILASIWKSARSGWGERRHTSKDIYTNTKAEDYDHLFASRISRTRPPYAIDKFLDHHFQHYTKRFVGEEKMFFKHLKYVIVPILQKQDHTMYVELVEEWLNEKKNVAPAKVELTVNEKLDKILAFLVENAIRNNISSRTIHEEIFAKAITFQEAQELHRKLLTSGKVRVIGHHYIGHSIDTTTFLQQGGFSGSINAIQKQTAVAQPPTIAVNSSSSSRKQAEVFISYSWDSKEHENNVGAFTNFLRKNGFDAQIDKKISQQETAPNFITMMHKAMAQHQKIIVVLSAGYKEKAEAFTGGVGEEYQILINDISQNPRKYILVSFEGRSSDIIPIGLKGRDIIDLSMPDETDKLFNKLMDQDEYIFSDVAPQKPVLKQKKFGEFKPGDHH